MLIIFFINKFSEKKPFYLFLVERTKMENATFQYETAKSKVEMKVIRHKMNFCFLQKNLWQKRLFAEVLF